MGDVTADLKTRYSIYVPKPLARINLGDWQRREGQVQSPKFGYAGVSIQTEKDMFVDVVKSTYLQCRGGFTVQTTDWFNCAQKALFMATADNATLGADGVMTIAAGAGQAPTWTLDHGDSLDVYPYNSLQLHYRVEEVQNSLFEFFRGRREKDYPANSDSFLGKLLEGLFRKDPSFNSAEKGSFTLNPLSDKGGNARSQSGAEEKVGKVVNKVITFADPEAELKGGFEAIAEKAWQALYGNKQFTFDPNGAADAKAKPAPYDIFGNMDDIRGNPTSVGYTAHNVIGDPSKTEKQLRYGFSNYFSRFDPYALINPDHPDINNPARPIYTAVMKVITRLHNATVRLKRTVDVMYKIGSLLKDNALSKLVVTAWQAVDAGFQAIKAARGQYEVWEAVALGSRGNLGDQFTDERESGWDKRIAIRNKLAHDWTPKTTVKAAVRSKAPEKDFVTGETKGFFGTLTATPGTTPPTATIAAMHVATNGAEFDLPAITVGAATAATIAGSAPTDAWTAHTSNRKLRVKFDTTEDWIEVDLGNPTIQSLAAATTADQGLASPHFVTDRATQITNVLNLIANASGMSGRAAVANGQITFTSAISGTLSKVQLRADPDSTLGLLGLKKVSAAGTDPSAALTADTIIAAWTAAWNAANPPVAPATTSPAPPWDGKIDITSEDGQIVFTSKAEGDGAFVRVSNGPVDSFDFKGDFRGESKYDEVRELDVHRRRLDSFQKLDEELLKIPDDTAALVRPAILLYKNATGVVTKTVGAFKAAIKILGLKLPQTKGAVGIVASKGISLGTPDRIVGAGGQGVVFIADGGTGIPDQAKYVILEEIINRITGADLLAPFFAKPYEQKLAKPSLGFRAYSDTSTDLIARNTANLLALGRHKDANNDVIGSGVARVAASYAVEIAAQEKVTIAARQEPLNPAHGTEPGRVEVLGHTIAIGYNEIDAKEAAFGLRDRTDAATGTVLNKGWPAEWRTPNDPHPHAKTASVIMHAADQACIVVGKYMVQLRAAKQADKALNASQAAQGRIDNATQQLDGFGLELKTLQGKVADFMAPLFSPEWDEYDQWVARITAINTVDIPAATQAKTKATAEKQAIDTMTDEGIIISMRDPADAKNFATSQWAHKGKPAIMLNEEGITLTVKADEEDDASGARVRLDAEGISISWNGKAGVRVKNDNSIHISDGTNKAAFTANAWNFQAGQVAFSNAKKITLG